MPKIAYQNIKFHSKSMMLIMQCNQIIAAEQADGYTLTLRQLYYKLVSRDIIPNTQRSYDNIGRLVNDARLAGLIDWSALEDRTRNLQSVGHWADPKSIIKACADSYALDKWMDQKVRPEIWVEKEALAGVIGRAADEVDVAYFSCRGYVSQSEMWGAARRFIARAEKGQATHIIHLGDHDPSGIDMSRDIEDRIRMFMLSHLGTSSMFKLERIALNRDQIDEYNPPPNPAKVTDSRFESYAAEFGDESWELDALENRVIDGLIKDAVARIRDDAKFDTLQALEDDHKELLGDCSRRWPEIVDFLA